MCGICGFDFEDKKKIEEMNKIISHRGPDDNDTYVKKVSLGHNRLSIIDLSSLGRQPMECLDYVIVFNGEIYNYKKIKEELSEYEFKSDSDTEVIIYAYDKWGKDCLSKFNGMFSFVIYDKKKKEFFISRDRFGIKPLYYVFDDSKFYFASEIKALLPFVDKEVSKEGLLQFFSFRFTMGENTLVKGVKKFFPGHYMIYDLSSKRIKRYDKFYSINSKITDKGLKYYKDKTKELIEKSVKRRMVSDVPVACLLSGGIDSSIITALAKKYNDNLNTFSIGFDTTNEIPYSKIVADKFNTNHRVFKINKDNVVDYISDMVYHMDEPIGDPGFLPIFVLSKEVSKYNKVVLSGDGADEVFCGYDRYKMFKYGKIVRWGMFYSFDNDILKRLENMRGKDDYGAFFEVIRLFDSFELEKLKVKEYDASAYFSNDYKDVSDCQMFDIKTLLPNDFFMKADKMSSAFGLEQRVPFLDHELVEFAFSMPLKYKLKLWEEKFILKESFKDVLPKEIVSRRKHGFDVPIDYWFKNVLGEKLKTLLDKSEHNLYNKEYVYLLLDKIKESGDNYKMNFLISQKLWSILMFEMWYERFVG